MFNLYCDESCHLPNDGEKVMVLGGIWCPQNKVRQINEEIRAIKKCHQIGTEMKWVKISNAKKQAYIDLLEYFFANDDLHFRVLIVDNKAALDHTAFSQTHDTWYYKMYFEMLKPIFDLEYPQKFNIYMDIKDTKSKSKIKILRTILSNSMHDFTQNRISNMQVIRSHEIEIMQLVDVLIGAISYVSRDYQTMYAKREIIDLIRKKSGYSLNASTRYGDKKFNIFHLQLQEGSHHELS
jgi:hypothetical protein